VVPFGHLSRVRMESTPMNTPEQLQPAQIERRRPPRKVLIRLKEEAQRDALAAIFYEGGRHVIDSYNEDPTLWVTSESTLEALAAAGVPFRRLSKPR
jgi:hypothetical protein